MLTNGVLCERVERGDDRKEEKEQRRWEGLRGEEVKDKERPILKKVVKGGTRGRGKRREGGDREGGAVKRHLENI